jgi:hypothetical protein
MADAFTAARKRQLARLGGAKPPAPRAAIALAKSQAYQDAADAPATLRAYATDLANYKVWCDRHGFVAMPATPDVVGAYLAAAGEGYAMPTLRRRVAAIARACGVAGHPLDTKHPAIRETLRGIGRKHGSRSRRTAAITAYEVRKPTAAPCAMRGRSRYFSRFPASSIRLRRRRVESCLCSLGSGRSAPLGADGSAPKHSDPVHHARPATAGVGKSSPWQSSQAFVIHLGNCRAQGDRHAPPSCSCRCRR